MKTSVNTYNNDKSRKDKRKSEREKKSWTIEETRRKTCDNNDCGAASDTWVFCIDYYTHSKKPYLRPSDWTVNRYDRNASALDRIRHK